MNESECMMQIARLFAAYPMSKATDATATEYCDRLVGLRYPQALSDAVTDLIEGEQWLPTVAKVRDQYRRHSGKYVPAELLPTVGPVDVEENKRRLRVLTDHLAGEGEHAGKTFSECTHPTCKAMQEGHE